MREKPLTARDIETLGELAAANKNLSEVGFRDGYARPMDCGGYNGSHHSYTLAKLAKRGFAERKGHRGARIVWRYWINLAGRAALDRKKRENPADGR